MEIIILGGIAAAAVLGLFIGFGKGFTRVNSWGLEFVFAAVIVLALGGVIGKVGDGIMPGVLMLGTTVVALIVLKILSGGLRGLFRKGKKRSMAREEYEYDEFDVEGVDEDDDGMSDSMDENEIEEYAPVTGKKGKKKKRKINNDEIRGACGILDRIFGAVALAVKGAVIMTLIFSLVLVFIDLIQIEFITNAVQDVFAGELWKLLKPRVMDLFVVAIIFLCVKSGFSSGFSQTLWSLIVLAMFAGAAFVSWNLAFNAPSFAGAAQSLADKLGTLAFLEKVKDVIPLINIAKSILTVAVFILLAVVIMILRIFVPRIIHLARNSSVVYFIDGVFGAVFGTAVILGVILFIGYVLQPISDLEMLSKFTAYFSESQLAKYMYGENLILATGTVKELPIREWLS